MKANRNLRIPNALVVSNPGVRGMDAQIVPIFLPEKEELANFSENPICPKCGEAYIPDESKEAEIIEVEVKAHTRKIIRCCMKKCCSCKGVPNTITAPMPPKVIPKSPYGISIWEAVLLKNLGSNLDYYNKA